MSVEVGLMGAGGMPMERQRRRQCHRHLRRRQCHQLRSHYHRSHYRQSRYHRSRHRRQLRCHQRHRPANSTILTVWVIINDFALMVNCAGEIGCRENNASLR